MTDQDDSVAIFWDYENCELPASADGFTIAGGIRSIAHQYGSVKVFKAYFEMSELTSQRSISVRSDLQACGVSLIDCPHNGRKDVADKMMLVDMLAHAIDNPAPSTIVLISGDRDFVYAVSILRLRKYRVVVLAPTAAHASLKAQASAVYEWPRHVLPGPADPALDGPSHAAGSAWTSHDGHGQVNLSTARTGLFTPPDSARTTPTLAARSSYFAAPSAHGRGHHTSASLSHSRTGTGYHHRASASTSSTTSGSSCLSALSFQGHLAGAGYSSSAGFTVKDDVKVFDLSHHVRESAASGARHPWYVAPASDPVRIAPQCGQTERASPDEETRGSPAGGLAGANSGSSPAASIAPLSSQPYAPTASPEGLSPEPLAHEDDDSDSDSASSVVVPTVTMTRLRPPPHKYRTLVGVLERERVQGNTRVAFSQLGSMLRAEDQNVYKRAGARQLRDYAEMAEEDGLVILGTSDWENGNRWTALHPTYHGKPPEASTPQVVGF